MVIFHSYVNVYQRVATVVVGGWTKNTSQAILRMLNSRETIFPIFMSDAHLDLKTLEMGWFSANRLYMYVMYVYIWVNYNDLTATSLESCLIREIIPQWP